MQKENEEDMEIERMVVKCPACGEQGWVIGNPDELVECAACRRVVRGVALDPTRKPRITAGLVVGAFGVALAAWVVWVMLADTGAFESQESESQVTRRLRAEAEIEARESISNHVVGITRVVRMYLNTDGAVPAQWKGWATAERVNRVGGIDRVELQLGPVRTDTFGDQQKVYYVEVRSGGY